MTAVSNLSQATPRMREAAQRLEGQFLAQMFKPMFESVRRGTFSGGSAEEQWQPMLTEAFASSMARSGGIGIRDMVLRHMIQIQSQSPQENRP